MQAELMTEVLEAGYAIAYLKGGLEAMKAMCGDDDGMRTAITDLLERIEIYNQESGKRAASVGDRQ